MTDISTKKTIEVWDGETGSRLVVYPIDSYVRLTACDEEGVPCVMRFEVGLIGPICRALHEVAQNVLENTSEDDGEA